MDSSYVSCSGSAPVSTPRPRQCYSLTPSVTASPTSRGIIPFHRSTNAVHDLKELEEDQDALGVLPTGAHQSVSSEHDRKQSLSIRGRSSFTSVRSVKNDGASNTVSRSGRGSQSASYSTTTLNLQHMQSVDADLKSGRPSVNVQDRSGLGNLPAEVMQEPIKMKKRPALRKLFSFAPFSRQSVQAAMEAQQRAEANTPSEQGSESPETTVSKWMAMLENQSEGRASVGTQSTSSSYFGGARIPNARKPTNSVNSRQSTAEALSPSSRTSSYTNTSIKSGWQRTSQRTPSPEMPQIKKILTGQSAAKDTPTIEPAKERASSPTPTQHTRNISTSSIQTDAVICDAAVTTVLVRGRPKSVYGTHIMDMAQEPGSAAAVVVARKPVAMSALRPKPKVLQLVKRTSSDDAPLGSPNSATSSMPSLYNSSSSESMTPGSLPGTPATESNLVFAPFSTDSTSWLNSDKAPVKAAPPKSFPLPPRTSLASTPTTPPITTVQPNATSSGGRPLSTESSNARHISLSPFTATALRTALTRFPRTPPPPNPYTTAPNAPFPSPSASTTSPYSSLYTSRTSTGSSSPTTAATSASSSPSSVSAVPATPEQSSYFRLPPSSSAHPSLYPDLLAAKSTTVGMTLTREEAELIARMRVKRAKMRREELERLGRALGVEGV